VVELTVNHPLTVGRYGQTLVPDRRLEEDDPADASCIKVQEFDGRTFFCRRIQIMGPSLGWRAQYLLKYEGFNYPAVRKML
jgi:hypothetical protein